MNRHVIDRISSAGIHLERLLAAVQPGDVLVAICDTYVETENTPPMPVSMGDYAVVLNVSPSFEGDWESLSLVVDYQGTQHTLSTLTLPPQVRVYGPGALQVVAEQDARLTVQQVGLVARRVAERMGLDPRLADTVVDLATEAAAGLATEPVPADPWAR